MDEAVGGLEIEFKRVVNDLEYVSHHLEKDFRSRQASNGGTDVVALIRRISALESNLHATKKRSEKLLSRRQQVTSMSASIMLSNHARLSRLLEEFGREEHPDNAHVDLLDVEEDKENGQVNSNVNGPTCSDDSDTTGMNHTTRMKMEECSEVRQELLDVLKECTFVSDPNQFAMIGGGDGNGTSTASSSSSAFPPPIPATAGSMMPAAANNSGTGDLLTDPSSSHLPSTTTHPTTSSDVTASAAVSTKASSSSISSSTTTIIPPAFDVITLSQFETVSSSTRGRCKLTDCQALLSRLVAHYTTTITTTGHKKPKKGGGNAATAGSSLMLSLQSVPAMSLTELGAMGLKVSGHSGDCVVNTLRALNLVKSVKTSSATSASVSMGAGAMMSSMGVSGSQKDTGLPGLALSDHALQALHAQLSLATTHHHR